MSTMDRRWKREQHEFLERQRHRLGASCGLEWQAPEPLLQPNPHAPRPQFTGCYTRNPRALFSAAWTFPVPMNRDRGGFSAEQPVRFTNVTLAVRMGTHAVGSFFPRATVNFITGFTQLFSSEDAYLRRMPSFSGVVRVPGRAAAAHVDEALAFLYRGHSLLHPVCRCAHGLHAARAEELGIYPDGPMRDGMCTLPTAARARGAEEIAAELGVGDIYTTLADSTGRSIADALYLHDDVLLLQADPVQWHRFAVRGGLDAVSNKAELLELVNRSVLCVGPASGEQPYANYARDVQELAGERHVYAMFNGDKQQWAAYPRRAEFDAEVDDDIKALWAACAPEPAQFRTHDEWNRRLASEGLAATRCAPAPACAEAERAPAGRGKRRARAAVAPKRAKRSRRFPRAR